MEDKAFLIWLHQRLVHVHKEDPFYDYMWKLRSIIEATPADRITPNTTHVEGYDKPSAEPKES